MKTVELVTVGPQKFAGLKTLEKEYLQKINYYVKCNLQIVKEFRHKDERMVKETEGERMSRHFVPGDLVIALEPRGKKMDSLQFAQYISRQISYHAGRIIFLIGGFAGLSPKLEERINLKLSFSEMTIAHDLFRVVFLEQLYRALTIIHGANYHR